MQVSCYDYALGYLSRYPKTAFALDKQLQKKGYENQEREEAIGRLEKIGFLDDRLYAEMYLRSEVVRKGKPLFVIQQKLYQKGVAKEVTATLVEEMEEELTHGQIAKITKEYQKMQTKGIEQQKSIQKLQSRGYNYTLIHIAIEKRGENLA